MNRYLNVGLMQFEISDDTGENLKKIRKNVHDLANGLNPPEMVLGPELGLGLFSHDTVPGKITEELGAIAREYNIYLLAGSMRETLEIDGRTVQYNTLPIMGPDGSLIDKYRKICPYYPVEGEVTPGDRYVVFEIKEKKIKVGVMICHDWCFPEISRNLTLMGAEILFRPAVDPEGLYESFKYVPSVRALENQAYFISLNTVGSCAGSYAYGHSIVADPEGKIIYESGGTEVNHCITLDADFVRRNRIYGTFFTEQLVRQIKLFDIPTPFADKLAQAPIFENLPEADRNLEERFARIKEIGLNCELGNKR